MFDKSYPITRSTPVPLIGDAPAKFGGKPEEFTEREIMDVLYFYNQNFEIKKGDNLQQMGAKLRKYFSEFH